MTETPRTLMEFLNASRDYLKAKGIENARGDAEALLGLALKLPRIQLYVQHDRLLKPAEISAFRELLARRGKREPLQLIIGEVEFCGIKISVSPGLLIPRLETEELAEAAIEWAQAQGNRPLRALDIGTGTGCLAIALASHVPNMIVDAVDVDFEALKCSASNAARHSLEGRVNLLAGDVMSERFLESVRPPYDVVISNPPYVSEEDFHSLPPEVRLHESRAALVATNHGMAFYYRVIELASSLLKPGALLAVEVGYDQAREVADVFRSGFEQVLVKHDLSGVARIVCGFARKE